MASVSDPAAILLGQHFGKSLCEHFGLPAGQVSNLKVNAGLHAIFSVTIDVAITAADLQGIAFKLQLNDEIDRATRASGGGRAHDLASAG